MGNGFSFIYYKEEWLDAVSFGSFLSFSLSFLGDSTNVLLITADLRSRLWVTRQLFSSLHFFTSTLGADRYPFCPSVCLFWSFSSPSSLTPSFCDCVCMHPCLFPRLLCWLLLQSGYTLCHLTVIISKKNRLLLSWSWLLSSCMYVFFL